MKIKTIALGAALLVLSPAITPSEAQARQMCRDYTKTSLINGRLHTGTAQACTYDKRHWSVTSMRAQPAQRSALVSMIERDVFNLGGLNISFSTIRDYSAPVVYHSQLTQTRVRHVPVPVYQKHYKKPHPHHYGKHKNKHHGKYDRHDKYDRHERSDWRDGRRGGHAAFKPARIQHPHARLARP